MHSMWNMTFTYKASSRWYQKSANEAYGRTASLLNGKFQLFIVFINCVHFFISLKWFFSRLRLQIDISWCEKAWIWLVFDVKWTQEINCGTKSVCTWKDTGQILNKCFILYFFAVVLTCFLICSILLDLCVLF